MKMLGIKDQNVSLENALRLPLQVRPLERAMFTSDSIESDSSGVEPQASLIHCSPKTGCKLITVPGT